MLALIFGAVRARAVQALTIVVLTSIATAVAAAGPWYGFATIGKAAEAYLDFAPAGQRTVSVAKRIDTRGDPDTALREFAAQVRPNLPAGTAPGAGGLSAPITVPGAATPAYIALLGREGLCAHIRVDGACPQSAGQVALEHETARQFSLARGDVLTTVTSSSATPLRLTVTGLYTRTDPTEAYWSSTLIENDAALAPMLTVPATFAHPHLRVVTAVYDAALPDALMRGDGGFDLGAALTAADRRLGANQFRLTTMAGPLHQAITRDRDTILNGIAYSGLQLLLVTWFALGLAGWFTLRDRRPDAALLKLRGIGRPGRLGLAFGQHLVPLAAGAFLGAPAGYLLAGAVAGPVMIASDRQAALEYTVVAVGAVLAGGLTVLAAVEASVLSRPVAELLQQTQRVRGAWRLAVVDLLMFALAGAAVYQARAGGPTDVLGRAAPALVSLAVGMLVARVLSRVADRGGAVALRSGWLRAGLTAVRISRSPGADRLFVLVVLAVALFTAAAEGWAADTAARTARSQAELGASRVLNVAAPNRTALLGAVRAVDPGGREAMAVVRTRTGREQILEVDTARLGAVAFWRPEFGPVTSLPDAVAAGELPPLPTITGTRLTVTVRRDGSAPVGLDLHLRHEGTGVPVTVQFGVLRPGEQSVTVPVTGCAPAPGCRISRWEMVAPDGRGGRRDPDSGASVTVRRLDQAAPDRPILAAALLGDIARWRSAATGAAVDLAATDGALRLTIDSNPTKQDPLGVEAWLDERPLPLPALLAGPQPAEWRDGDALLPAYDEPVPVRVIGAVSALPGIGGSGLLVDLDGTRGLSGDGDPPGQFQVWLSPSARPSIVADLTAAGLTVTQDVDVAGQTGRLGVQGPAVLARFELLVGLAALVLAAAAVAVAVAVDRRSASEQLIVLRRQGLPLRTARIAGWAGTAALILCGVGGGALTAWLAAEVTGRAARPFTDGWSVLAPPGLLGPTAVLAAMALASVVLGLTGWVALRPTLSSLRGGGDGR